MALHLARDGGTAVPQAGRVIVHREQAQLPQDWRNVVGPAGLTDKHKISNMNPVFAAPQRGVRYTGAGLAAL